MAGKLSVLLTTEGTYPFHQGGVSTWCDMLVRRLGGVDFTVLAILTDPFITQKYSLPTNTKLIRIPLWGTDEPSEHLNVPFSSTYMAKQRTTAGVIQDRFLPIFDDFIRQILAKRKDSYHMGDIILRLYEFFRQYDYKAAFKSQLAWERYKILVQEEVAKPNSGLSQPDIYSLIQSLGWLYRFFNVINTNVPETSIAHASAAAFCGIPCVIAKLTYGTPFLLTEHGVYLREQYLSLSKRGYSSFLNTFLIRMIWSVTYLNYDFADQISPVCEYNTRWEKRITGRHDRIRVIYNGVDHRVFARIEPRERHRPTVVTVARIDPIKDLITLIRVAERVRRVVPNALFLVYGSVTVPEYFDRCQALIKTLELEPCVKLVGHTSDIVAAYDAGDIVLQTSISEAFPYSVIEAMLSGKPVVATAVGGVPEAVGQAGLLFNPGAVDELAQAVAQLLQNHEARLELGNEARKRALDLFTSDKSLNNYMRSYIRLSVFGGKNRNLQRTQLGLKGKYTDEAVVMSSKVSPSPSSQVSARRMRRLAMERAFALMSNGFVHLAPRHLMKSIRFHHLGLSDTPKLALLLSIYEHLGLPEEATKTGQALEEAMEVSMIQWQQLLAHRALAFAEISRDDLAVKAMKKAVRVRTDSPAAPELLMETSRILQRLGKTVEADELLAKAYRLSQFGS